MKKRDKLLQKQKNRFMNYKEIQRSYVELQNRLKTIEEKIGIK